MITLSRRQALALGGGAVLMPSALHAQAAWPAQPVTFVVGYSAGGGADIVARELAHLMTPLLGQQVIVDNKGGAAGAIGARFVSNAKPDGYTLFYAVGTNIVTNPHVLKASIDTLKGLVPIIQTTDYQYVLAVNPSVPANNVQELIALAKKEPGKLTFSSSGVGGNNHLAGALFAEAAGIDKSLIARAQEAIEQAVETTVGAVKDNPVAAAAIVGGVAAVAAGAAYGISKLSGAASDDGVAKTVGKSATAAKAK